jgi:metal-dependent amidase/aminoacylase/carboxypeptidase family protein
LAWQVLTSAEARWRGTLLFIAQPAEKSAPALGR